MLGFFIALCGAVFFGVIPFLSLVLALWLSLIDEDEDTFEYPWPTKLPWLRWLTNKTGDPDPGGITLLCLVVGLINFMFLIPSLYSRTHPFDVTPIYLYGAVIIGVVYGLYWLARKYIRVLKERQKVYDRLKGK